MLSAILVLVIFLVLIWSFNTTTIYLLQKEFLYWNYFSHILMIAISIGAIAVTKKDFTSLGFTIKNYRSDFSIAVICVISAASFIPSLIFPVIASNEALNSLLSIGAILLALFVVSKEEERKREDRATQDGDGASSACTTFFYHCDYK